MSLEPHHHLATSATSFSATLAECTARGWVVQRSAAGRGEIAVIIGSMGIVITGEPSAEARTLHTRAGQVCAALPAALRRHVLVVGPGTDVDLAALPAVFTGGQVDLAVSALAGGTDAEAFTVAKVLEWTRHAQPEPARGARPSRLEGPAVWLSRHALLLAVLTLGVAMLSIVGLDGSAGHPVMADGPAHTISAAGDAPAPDADDRFDLPSRG